MKITFKNTTGVNYNHLKNLVAHDELRPALSNIYIDIKNQCLVGTNAHVMVVYPIEVSYEGRLEKGNEGRLVPLRFFQENRYMIDLPAKTRRVVDLEYVLTDEYAEVYFLGEMIFRCKYIDSKFVNYEAAILGKESEKEISQIGLCLNRISELVKSIPNDGLNNYKLTFNGTNKGIIFTSTNKDMDRPIKALLMPIYLDKND
jgi:hypothetical protein